MKNETRTAIIEALQLAYPVLTDLRDDESASISMRDRAGDAARAILDAVIELNRAEAANTKELKL